MEKGTYYKAGAEQPVDCDLVLKDKALYIYLNDTSKELLIWQLNKSLGSDFNGARLKLFRAVKPDEWLLCEGQIAFAAHNALNQPGGVKKPERMPLAAYTPFLVTCLVIAGIGLLAYFFLLPWLGKQAVRLIPVNIEIEMGEALSKQYAIQGNTNDSADYYANRFWTGLKVSTVYPVHINILKSKELNAFALPGGHIFIYSGLLAKMNTYEELGALLGHEASHVTHRHSLKSIMRQAAAGLVISALLGDIAELSGWVISKADEFKQLDYSRELETEADDEGYNMMISHGLDPRGMLRLLQLLQKESAETPAMMKYLSTHPDTEARIENIESKPALNKTYAPNPELETLFRQLKSQVAN